MREPVSRRVEAERRRDGEFFGFILSFFFYFQLAFPPFGIPWSSSTRTKLPFFTPISEDFSSLGVWLR